MATAIDIIAKAKSYLGITESPKNSNNVIFNTWYYGREVSGSAYPWCCAFVAYVFNKCDASHLFYGGKKTAYCPTVENYYKSIGRYFPNNQGQKGDLCLMDFGKGRASHIGIVEKKNADGSYTVIEGNTSTTSNDNGGCVMRRTRKSNVIRGFARPNYNEKNEKKASTTNTAKKSYFEVKVTVNALNIRSGAGILYKKIGCIRDKGIYTIVKTSGNWGYLKSDAGWINISSNYVRRIQ